MERAFVNLVGNALEAMPEGGQRAHFGVGRGRFRADSAWRTRALASRPRSAPNLFQPFVTAGKRNGLGLGLALTRQTVIEHGGDMWVESEPGRGARFVFRLPGAQVSHPAPVHA